MDIFKNLRNHFAHLTIWALGNIVRYPSEKSTSQKPNDFDFAFSYRKLSKNFRNTLYSSVEI